MGINDNGQIVGVFLTAEGRPHAYLYDGGLMTDLGTLGGYGSYPYDINNRGQVVGYSQAPGGTTHAFVYENGVISDLGTLPGTRFGYARSINESGQIVGFAEGAHSMIPFLYDQGQMVDLNSLIPADSGWTLQYAYSINDAGQIVGTGSNISGLGGGFLLTPIAVPEPTLLSLLCLCLGGLCVSRRRRA